MAGHADTHATLWSQALGALARPTTEVALATPDDARISQRVALCGLADDAQVAAPDGTVTRLQRDPATSSARCGGFWPRMAGWHRLATDEATVPFFVRERDDALHLHATAVREQTQRLASRSLPAAASTTAGSRGPAWPWFLGWLFAAGLLWWLERRRPAAG